MWLLAALIAVPLIEIVLFIQIGGLIGLWPTILVVILTAAIGASMLRRQGLATVQRLQAAMARGEDPSDQLAQGALILFAGALLLTPGFFTDGVGFALLNAPIRERLIDWARPRMAARVVRTTWTGADGGFHRGGGRAGPVEDGVIETEYRDVTETPPRRDPD
ncbi:MAG: FxsA family protein [Rubrimonas sp.]|uniref:FxsA family protein n=1 Tax=Rubrimonas sp. TaxID=2036015 RepID=UPI002FDD0513